MVENPGSSFIPPFLFWAKQGTKKATSDFYFVSPAYSATSHLLLMNQEERLFCINKHDLNKDIKATQMRLTSTYFVFQYYGDVEAL